MDTVWQREWPKDTHLPADLIWSSSLGWTNAHGSFAGKGPGYVMSRRFFPKSEIPLANGMKSITPQVAGWRFSGLSIIQLAPNIPYDVDATFLGGAEGALIPLNATDLTIKVDEESFELVGRLGVFRGPTDWIYCAPGSRLRITAPSGGEIALATATAQGHYSSCRVDALSSVEIRGAGAATREVRPFMHPDIFKDAERLMAVEVITPDGNVSSYPPHRHDGVGDCLVANEEIYYFRIGKVGLPHGDAEGFGFHRTYADSEYDTPFDDTITIHDGDIYLVPLGFHGPCSAMPGYPMYYLNVLAGENFPRSMDFCDDPNHAWIRQSWKVQTPDARVPWRVT